MVFFLIIGAVLIFVLTGPGLVKLDARRSQSRILNADWLPVEDRFRIVSRWGQS